MKFAEAGILYMGNVGRSAPSFPRRPGDLPLHLADSAKSDGELFPSETSIGRELSGSAELAPPEIGQAFQPDCHAQRTNAAGSKAI